MGRKIAWVLSLALLIISGVLGVRNGVTEWNSGTTPAQKSVPIGVFLYGVLGLATAYGLFRRRRWSVGTAIAWGIAITYVPGVAIMAFGGDGAILSSAIAASTGSAVIAAGVIWTAIVMTRGDTEPAAST
jgi:hypothetical protein